MHNIHSRSILILSVALVYLISCAEVPSRPKVGTPEFFWTTALAAYESADYPKAAETLDRFPSAENPYTARTRMSQIFLDAGLANGYAEIADRYFEAMRINRAKAAEFRKHVTDARNIAQRHSLRFTETLHRFLDTDKSATIQLPLPYPAGTTSDPPPLLKLKAGTLLQGAEVQTLETAVLQRNVIDAANRLAGAAKDAVAAAKVFQAGSVEKGKFLVGAAELLYMQSALFGPDKLDRPRRQQALCTEALEALAAAPSTPETKALESKIKRVLDKIKT